MIKSLSVFIITLFSISFTFCQETTHPNFFNFGMGSERNYGSTYSWDWYYGNRINYDFNVSGTHSKIYGKHNRLETSFGLQTELIRSNDSYLYYLMDYMYYPYPISSKTSSLILSTPVSQTYFFNSPIEHKFSFGTQLQLALNAIAIQHTNTIYSDTNWVQHHAYTTKFFPKGNYYNSFGPSVYVGIPLRANFGGNEYVQLTPKIDVLNIMYRGLHNSNLDFGIQLNYGFKTK